MESAASAGLGADKRQRLISQRDVMRQYGQLLAQRISAWQDIIDAPKIHDCVIVRNIACGDECLYVDGKRQAAGLVYATDLIQPGDGYCKVRMERACGENDWTESLDDLPLIESHG